MNILEQITTALLAHVQATFNLTAHDVQAIDVTLNVDAQKVQFGDVTTNAALILAQQLQQNPRAIAQQITSTFTHNYIKTIEIAGPGFINFFLTPQAFMQLAHDLFEQENSFFKLDSSFPKHNYNIEFVSANPTGPLHLGHGRGGIIGDVLGNIVRFLGHAVTKEFYINDAGVQIQKLGNSFKIRCEQLLGSNKQIPEDGYQGEYLVILAQQCVSEYGAEVLQKPDTFFAQYAQDHLLANIKKTLLAYGITFDVWFSEKTLHESGAITRALELLQKNGYLYESEGALWFKSTEFGDDKDRVVRKNTGELTYVAADIAYLLNKLERGADKLVMVLGQDHHSYVVRLKAVLQGLGKNPDILDVILYQLVTLKETGQMVRMSKRAGKIVSLEDIIETVGADVARFFYLNRKADAHLDFDVDLALKHTDENPVFYIQYAYVRTNSILEKAYQNPALCSITAADTQSIAETEALLLKKIIALKELLVNISHNYQTHALSYYVLELAHLFHHYYSINRVIEADNIPQSRSRLALIIILQRTFGLCLNLLGISTPQKM